MALATTIRGGGIRGPAKRLIPVAHTAAYFSQTQITTLQSLHRYYVAVLNDHFWCHGTAANHVRNLTASLPWPSRRVRLSRLSYIHSLE